MSVQVDQITTEVDVTTPPSQEQGAAQPSPWETRWRIRQQLAGIARDALRTRAEGYDD